MGILYAIIAVAGIYIAMKITIKILKFIFILGILGILAYVFLNLGL